MSNKNRLRRLSIEDKLAVLLGTTRNQAQQLSRAAQRGRLPDESLKAVVPPRRMPAPRVRALLSSPHAIVATRLAPTSLRLEQALQIPGVKRTRAQTLLDGGPYYSLAEMTLASGLERPVLEDIFELPPLIWRDKVADAVLGFEPIDGHYLIPAASEFELADPVTGTGFVQRQRQRSHAKLRIVEPASFEAPFLPHLLKQRFAGEVTPLVRDREGMARVFSPRTLDIWFAPETSPKTQRRLLARFGLSQLDGRRAIGYCRATIARTPAERDMLRHAIDTITRLQTLPQVRFAELEELDFEHAPGAATAADKSVGSNDRYWNAAAIELDKAHQITKGSKNVVIMVVDSGARTDHADLESGLLAEWPQIDLNYMLGVPAAERSPHEEQVGHGTQVAGVIRHIAPKCRLLPVKVSGASSVSSFGLRAAAIMAAVQQLGPARRGVLSISWKTSGMHIGIREALRVAEEAGVPIVTSAGSYHPGEAQFADKPHYPSDHHYKPPALAGLCAVAGLAFGDAKASYSYFGSSAVNIAAPGGEAGGGDGIGIFTASAPEPYAHTAGTSFAAPHVAGVLGLMLAADMQRMPASEWLTPAEARTILLASADAIDDENPVHHGQLGHGRVNALKALQRVAARTTVTPPADLSRDTTAAPAAPHSPLHEELPSTARQPPNPANDAAPDAAGSESAPANSPLNINRANASQLMTLPYIGSYRARSIVDHRKCHGAFGSLWGLIHVRGMDGWTVAQLARLIVVA